jgi:hypothetical protein
MTDKTAPRLSWVPAFLTARKEGLSIRKAAKAAGVSAGTANWLRREDAQFARDWEEAIGATRCPAQADDEFRRTPHWRKDFFEALAETSNVTASAARANVPVQTVYKLRRENAEFANKWRAALLEGYDLLEMELLGHLRDPKPGRKLDVAAAIRLLAAHRATVERERTLREEDDEEAVRASIVAFLEGMRQRRLANEAILIEAETDDVAG